MKTKKRIVISCGTIPVKLSEDEVIVNAIQSKRILDMVDEFVADSCEYEVTILAHAIMQRDIISKLGYPGGGTPYTLHLVENTGEYCEWLAELTTENDTFIMAASIPITTHGNNHPRKNDRSIIIDGTTISSVYAGIKRRNPNACLIEYTYKKGDRAEILETACKIMRGSEADMVIANNDSSRTNDGEKLALMPDGSVVECAYGGHITLVRHVVDSNLFSTVVVNKQHNVYDSAFVEAERIVSMYEKTFPHDGPFDKIGAVAVPVRGENGTVFVTSGRYEGSQPVTVYGIDHDKNTITATGIPALSTAAFAAAIEASRGNAIVVCRNKKDPLYDCDSALTCDDRAYHYDASYTIPGSTKEMGIVKKHMSGYNGHITKIRFVNTDITVLPIREIKDIESYPQHLFRKEQLYPEDSIPFILRARDGDDDASLELCAGGKSGAKYVYKSIQKTEDCDALTNATEIKSEEELFARNYSLIFAKDCINFFDLDFLKELLSHTDRFWANACICAMPDTKKTPDDVTLRHGNAPICLNLLANVGAEKVTLRHGNTLVCSNRRLKDDTLLRTHYYIPSIKDYESLGLTVTPYSDKLVLITKGFYEFKKPLEQPLRPDNAAPNTFGFGVYVGAKCVVPWRNVDPVTLLHELDSTRLIQHMKNTPAYGPVNSDPVVNKHLIGVINNARHWVERVDVKHWCNVNSVLLDAHIVPDLLECTYCYSIDIDRDGKCCVTEGTCKTDGDEITAYSGRICINKTADASDYIKLLITYNR